MQRKNNYFAAGPTHLPESILSTAQEALINFNNSGLSIVELAHRNGEVEELINTSKNLLRKLLNIPTHYEILFMGGGASFAFANVPLNIKGKIGYVVTGRWGMLAYNEAHKINPKHVKLYDGKDIGYTDLPDFTKLDLNQIEFLHYTSNETVHGIQFKTTPNLSIPLICDMSSDILTNEINWDKYALIYAGCAKNLGIAGLHLAVFNPYLINPLNNIPNIYNLHEIAKSNSLYNTPPVFQIYITYLMLNWVNQKGGLNFFKRKSIEQAQLIYSLIDTYSSMYISRIKPEYRSNINIVFDLPNPSLISKFLAEAADNKLYGLKGHAVLGGIRASLYNSITLEQVKELATFMQNFAQKHQNSINN